MHMSSCLPILRSGPESFKLNSSENARVGSLNTTPEGIEDKEKNSGVEPKTKPRGIRLRPICSRDSGASAVSNVTENQDFTNDLISSHLSELTASIESTQFGIQAELPLLQSDLVIVPIATAVSPDMNTILLSQASLSSTLSIDSPTGFFRPNISINFSDDESAGLVSSGILD